MKTNLEAVKENLKKRIDNYTARIEMWEGVKRVYKKDGTPFKVLSKNFTGARFEDSSKYDPRPELHVFGRIGSRYESETLNAWGYVDEHKFNPEGREINGGGCVREWFVLTPDEIEQEVAERIAQLKGYRADLEKQLADADDIFTTFSEAIEKAFAEMTAKAGKYTSLYYECRDFAKNLY